MTAPVEPRRYRRRNYPDVIVEAVPMDHTNYRAVCDWINGEPMAWKRGYDGHAFPDFCGLSIPRGETGHQYVRWGYLVVKEDDGFRGWEPSAFEFVFEEDGNEQ